MRSVCTALIISLTPALALAGTQEDDTQAEAGEEDPQTKPGSRPDEPGEPAEQENAAPPVDLSGQLMLRYTQNLDPGATNGAELYNVRIYLDRKWQNWRVFAEPRFRQSPLRSFSPSNVWIQQAWVGYDQADGYVDVHAGVIYRRFGLFWDNSWFGNLPYLNAHKLNPDYGIEARGTLPVVDGFQLEYDAQFMAQEDGLNGFFATDAKLTALSAGIDQPYTLDFDSSPNHTERHVVIGALHPKITLGDFEARLGGSAMTSELASTVDGSRGRRIKLGGDVTLSYAGASIYGEFIRVTNSGFGDDTRQRMALAGLAYAWTQDDSAWLQQLSARVNGSQISYDRDDIDEYMVTGGVHARIHEFFGVTAEYVWWEFDEDRVVNRIEWILHAYF